MRSAIKKTEILAAMEPIADPGKLSPETPAAGTHYALAECMELYDVKARGFYSPLNAGEIAQLFRAGHFDRRLPCKPREESTWRTIDELFPLLKYGAAGPPLRFDAARRARKRGPFTSSCALILALLGITMFHIWVQRAPTVVRHSDPRKQSQIAEPFVAQAIPAPAFTSTRRPAAPSLDQGVVVADQTRIR